MITASRVIEKFGLEPLPREGGWFRQTYCLKDGIGQPRSTAIYFLVESGQVTQPHRLPGDELYHFYAGDPVILLLESPEGLASTCRIGSFLDCPDCRPQRTVSAGTWQSVVSPRGPTGWTLLGTTMTPGFSWNDYEEQTLDTWLTRNPAFAQTLAQYGI